MTPSKLPLSFLNIVTVLGFLVLAPEVRADVPLTRAEVEAISNRVELIPRGQAPRQARLSDYLDQGDSLKTAAASRAELRFNDGSLARVGEHATFRFIPGTRNFHLSNGTVLLLIPPGQGRSVIQTPNVVAGLQGTALVVRHVASRDLTLVMALTNSHAGPMSVGTADGTQEVPLYAGQMALVQKGVIQVVEFDLEAFYQTSDLVEGLLLDDVACAGAISDPGENIACDGLAEDPINAVRQETLSALYEQPAFTTSAGFLNPNLIETDAEGSSEAQEAAMPPFPTEGNPLSTSVNNDIPPQVVSTPMDTAPVVGTAASEVPPPTTVGAPAGVPNPEGEGPGGVIGSAPTGEPVESGVGSVDPSRGGPASLGQP